MTDAPAPEEVSARLRAWLGGGVSDASSPSRLSGGFDFWIYAVHFRGGSVPPEWEQPLVVRIPPAPERFEALEHETRLQGWVAEHGYPAPAVVALVPPGELFASPVQVVVRVPGGTLTTALTSRPWQLPRLVGGLGVLHARLHDLQPPEWAAGPDWSIEERRLSLVRWVLERVPGHELATGLARVEQDVLPALAGGETAICHGDFHPMNVLADPIRGGARLSVIDWTDSGIGDPHCDVARTAWLFRFASVAAPSRTQRAVVRSVGAKSMG